MMFDNSRTFFPTQSAHSPYYFYRKSTATAFFGRNIDNYNNEIKKKQYLIWTELPEQNKQIFEKVSTFASNYSINLVDRHTQKPQKPPTPFFLYTRVVQDKLKAEYPKARQSEIFEIARALWVNDLSQSIKEEFIKINIVLNQVYVFELMHFRAENPVEIRNIKNSTQGLQSHRIGLKQTKFPIKNCATLY